MLFCFKEKKNDTNNKRNRFITLTVSPNLIASIKRQSRSQNSKHGKIHKSNDEKQ